MIFNADHIAKQLGYPLPLDEFGITRWEADNGWAFVVAAGDATGGLSVHVGHRVETSEEEIGRFTIDSDGHANGGWLGEADIPPERILEKIISALEVMGQPVFVDSGQHAI